MYPVDASEFEALRFFEQREWRLVSNVLDARFYDASAPNPDERTLLLEVDRAYYSKVINLRSRPAARIDECILVRKVRGRRFLDYARRVVVPQDALSTAPEIVAPAFPDLLVGTFET